MMLFPDLNAPKVPRGRKLSSHMREKFLGAVHWVGAVTHGAEGSYLSYKFIFAVVCGVTMV